MELSPRELIVILLAREIRDGEICLAAGVGGIAFFSAMLAKRLHAPNLNILGTGNNPEPDAFFQAINDARNFQRAESYMDFFEVFRITERGLDFCIYSGLQIDKFGNVNLHFIGSYPESIKVSGPGVANTSFAVTSKRTLLYLTEHSKRTLVERVDFVSVAGFLSGGYDRKRHGIETLGPSVCITPMAVFDFDTETKEMRIKSINPGFTLKDVLNNTGFNPVTPKNIPTTPCPTHREIETLRSMDKYGILRNS